MEQDAILATRAAAGDSAAFGLLYDRHAGVIRAICFDETRDVHAANELAQEVFLRAFAGLPRLRSTDRFAPWLISISRFVCREWRRSRRRDRHQYTSHVPEPAGVPAVDIDDSASRLRMAITRLPEQERLALHAFYLNGESAEVARQVLGLSRAGFYKVLERARRQLAGMLQNTEETIR